MAWESKYANYGVIKIEGSYIRIYCSNTTYLTISVGENVTSASWAGIILNVVLSNGKIKRYSDVGLYTTIN